MKKIVSWGIAVALTLTTSACSATVPLEPAELANDPNCAEVSVRLPDEIGGQQRRSTNAQATAAYGQPTTVIVRCGLPAVAVSTLPCVTAGDVDWLVDASASPSYRFISFARTPATEVVIDSQKIAGVTTLEALAGAVGSVPASARCSG